MPILDHEILWRPAALVSDVTPSQNGGRMRFAQLVSGVKNNLFPDVSQSERLAGAVKWRKAFIHINSAQDTALLNVRLFLDALTPAGDFVTFCPGTRSDTEDQISGRLYGIATLKTDVPSGATQLEIVGEHPVAYTELQPFRVGDLVRIADRPSTGGAGNEEWVTLTAVTYTNASALLELAAPLANSYGSTGTLVASVWQQASVVGVGANFTLSSVGGSFDSATVGNWIVHNRGAIDEHWTLVFSGSTTFTVSGLSVGALPQVGSTSADFMPTNPNTGTPYFTLKASGWSGSFQAGEQGSFDTTPAAVPIWYRRQVPAGTFSLANDYASLAIHGESA